MPKQIDFCKVKEEVRQLTAEIAEISADELTDTALFAEDLGVDSMMALEIVAKIEKKYKVIIPEEKIPTMQSLANVYDLLEGILKK